jgi:hypothetical protein
MNQEQYGFRKNLSTADFLIMIILESKIQEDFSQKQHLISVSFDLDKEYGTAWRYNILRYISRLSIKGNIFFFIQNFMTNLTFRVQIGDTTSKNTAKKTE